MIRNKLAARTSVVANAAALAATLATTLLLAAPAQAQNIAIVNGKAVPKARVDLLLQQAQRAGQQISPEMQGMAKEEVVKREIFAQEAEKRGIAAQADYKAQMDLARQSILIRELFEDHKKKNPVTRRGQGRLRQVQGPVHRHRIPGPPHPGRGRRRGQGLDRPDQGRRQV